MSASRGLARLLAAPFILAAPAFLMSPAEATSGDVVIGAGPHEATPTDGSSAVLVLSVWNVSTAPLTLSLHDLTGCERPSEQPAVPASSQADVTFTMHCSDGDEQRTAILTATPTTGTSTTVDVPFTLAARTGPDGGPMLLFLVGIGIGLAATLLPYWYWTRNPEGNPDPSAPSDTSDSRTSAERWATPQTSDPSADAPKSNIVVRAWKSLSETLPGITKDWSFVDNWASNAGLATALFTGVFAATDPLKVVLGTDASQAQSTIIIASALAVALIGAAPLLLVICKRRFRKDHGVARHHTVGGVLAATLVVITASTGLVLTAASVLGGWWPWTAAIAASAVLLVYSWKSIPQTLALGRYQAPDKPPAMWAVDLRTSGGKISGGVTEGSRPAGDTAEDGTLGIIAPRRHRADLSAMP